MNAAHKANASLSRKDALLDRRIEVNGAFISRRDFITRTLAAGGHVEAKPFTWKNTTLVRKPEYRLYLSDQEFHIITKTEFDFACSLGQ